MIRFGAGEVIHRDALWRLGLHLPWQAEREAEQQQVQKVFHHRYSTFRGLGWQKIAAMFKG